MGEKRNRRSKTKMILLLGVFIWSLFIWSNSCRKAVQSAGQSLQVLACFQPLFQALHIPDDIGHVLIRKMAHMSEFFVLGCLWTAALLWGELRHMGSNLLHAGGFCLITALVDETIQLVTPGRGSLVSDVWIDFAGSCIGILLASVVYKAYRHRHLQNNYTIH